MERLRRWNARVNGWGETHPWRFAAVSALGFVVVASGL